MMDFKKLKKKKKRVNEDEDETLLVRQQRERECHYGYNELKRAQTQEKVLWSFKLFSPLLRALD